MDWSPIVQPILGVIGLVLAGVLALLANKAIAALSARNIIQLTDQQRAQVLGAVQTASGIITAQLARGAISLNNIHPSDPAVQAEVAAAIARVPDAAAALGVTQQGVAEMVVGAVGRAIANDPTVPTVPTLESEPIIHAPA